MLALCNFLTMNLRKTIYIVMVTLDAEVLCKVDDLHILWDSMF